jgi:hypothetical protein
MSRTAIIIRIDGADQAAVLAPSGYAARDVRLLNEDGVLQFGLHAVTAKCEKLGFTPPETAFDLLALAAAVTAADTRVDRGTAQDRWTRELHLSLPVADPALWASLADRLSGILNFLSGDRWSFGFRVRPAGRAQMVRDPETLRTWQPSCVSLLSGGLDSFIGAIDLLKSKAEPLFVSHYWDSDTSAHQSYCLERLQHHYPKHVMDSVRARIGFDADFFGEGATENSLRARSFLFFAMAVYVASGAGKPTDVIVPENGFISLNVPLDGLRLGALSTRTTHPWYMARWNQLLQALGLPIALANPYRFLTKGEMLAKCLDVAVVQKELAHTMSCSSANKLRWKGEAPKHCGYCVPCIIRRAAVKAAFGRDYTPYGIKSLTAQPLNSQKAEGEHIRSFQAAIRRIEERPKLARFLIHQPGPLIDHENELAQYERIYTAGLAEVAALVKGIDVRPL